MASQLLGRAEGVLTALPWAARPAVPLRRPRRRPHLPPLSLGARDESLLEAWLRSLLFAIPDQKVSAFGFDIDISGKCGDIDLQAIDTTKVTPTKIEIVATGLAIDCDIDWSAKGAVIPIGASGKVTAVIDKSTLSGSLALQPDKGNPPLPIALVSDKSDCHSVINVADLKFEGGIIGSLLNVLSGVIKGLLTDKLGPIICENVDGLITVNGTKALGTLNGALREYLAVPSVSPEPPADVPDPNGDLARLDRNPLPRFLDNLLTKVISNSSSNNSLNAIMSRIAGPDGNVSLAGLGLPPFRTKIVVPKLATIGIELDKLSFAGLNKWSSLSFKADNPHQVSTGFLTEKLTTEVAMKLTIDPAQGPIHGTDLTEKFDLTMSVHGFGLSTAFFTVINTTFLNTLAVEQYVSLGCIAPALALAPPMESLAGLNMSLAEFSLAPLQSGGLEDGVDKLINQLLGDVLRDYALAIQAVGNHALSVSARDAINEKLRAAIASPRTCPPPAPSYASQSLSDGALYMACALGIVSLAGLMFAPCSNRVALVAGKVRRRHDPRTVALNLQTERNGRSEEGTRPSGASPIHAADEEDHSTDGISLFSHPRLPTALRYCLPMLVLSTCFMFLCSNSGPGALVKLAVLVGGEPVVDLPPVFSFSLVSSIKDMWTAGVYPLAFLIAGFSGFWPYMKLWLMLLCWFSPTWFLTIARRQSLLDFLDAYGKWSLVDTYVLVMFMVAFRFELSGMKAASPAIANIFKELGEDASFIVYIEGAPGFFVFMGATILSLVLGHGMTACHRYVLKIGEFGVDEDYVGDLVVQGGKRRLCNVLRPQDRIAGKAFAYGPVAAVGASMVFVVVGIWVTTMEFRFLGLAGFLLGQDGADRPYSVLSLDFALPGSSMHPNGINVRVIQIAFVFFAAVTLPVYLVILMCLWFAPMKNRMHREFLVAAQILNAWSGTDVFCLSIFASVLQIRQFASFMIGDKCDLINKVLAASPLAHRLPGEAKCFDVESLLRPGVFLLSLSSIIAVVTGQILLTRCSNALFSVRERSDSMVARERTSSSAVNAVALTAGVASAATDGAR